MEEGIIKIIAFILTVIITAYRIAIIAAKMIIFVILRYLVYGVWLPAWIVTEERKKKEHTYA